MPLRWLLRALVLSPPALMAAGGLLQASRSPFEFSDRTPSPQYVLPYWAITLDALLLSLPFMIAGLWATSIVWRKTKWHFRVDLFHAAVGLFGVVPNVLVLFALRHNVESSFSYTMIFHSSLTAVGSLTVTLIAASVWCGIASMFLALYVTGIVSEGSGKYDKRPGETDAVGRLIEEMRSSKAR
jgi:hypothetical protein